MGGSLDSRYVNSGKTTNSEQLWTTDLHHSQIGFAHHSLSSSPSLRSPISLPPPSRGLADFLGELPPHHCVSWIRGPSDSSRRKKNPPPRKLPLLLYNSPLAGGSEEVGGIGATVLGGAAAPLSLTPGRTGRCPPAATNPSATALDMRVARAPIEKSAEAGEDPGPPPGLEILPEQLGRELPAPELPALGPLTAPGVLEPAPAPGLPRLPDVEREEDGGNRPPLSPECLWVRSS